MNVFADNNGWKLNKVGNGIITKGIPVMLLFAVLFLVFGGGSAFADNSGTCGDNLVWALDDTGKLTISGSGPMTDYSTASPAPWATDETARKAISIPRFLTDVKAC